MRLYEVSTRYYHGSMKELAVGTVLTPRDDYENDWQGTDFYKPLEHYRPKNMLSHKQSVFMCSDPDDVDLAGGGAEWLFTVEPIGPVQRHDMNWSSEISMLISDGYTIDSHEVANAAKNYWAGIPHSNESVWEYLTPQAKIIDVEPY
jgi:hypothetical protein